MSSSNGVSLAAVRAALAGGPPVCAVGLPAGAVPPAGTAVVVGTSGSTGAAKHVALSAAALTASAEATYERLGGPGSWLLALPAAHVAGIQVLVRSVVAGTEPVVVTPGFGGRAFVEAASEVLGSAGPRYTALVPTQLYRLVSGGGDPLRALAGFDAVLLGGAAAAPDLLDAARAAGVRVVRTYGMSETCGGCVYDGVPLAGVSVRVVAGVVELAGPVLASGYVGAPELTAASFVDGWFRTSDLGELGADGRLRILGRADDMINTGGVKVAAAAVARVLAGSAGVADAVVVDVPDPEWGQAVGALVVPAGSPDVKALRAAVRAELGPAAVPKVLRFAESLPLTALGKPDRPAVRALLRAP